MSKNAYQVIARRWRPQQFSELVGQEHVVRTLGNAIEMNRIAHAYLFVGPRGTGKTTSARLFAKSLNWEGGPSLEVPKDSEIGQSIMEGRCLDVIEIDGASNNSVDQVRQLRDECQYSPSQCRFKIYVIDEVHMLSQAAFNALLKTLEEPPAHVKFVFATTESQKVLPTIVSRCQRFEFRSIPASSIQYKLSEICEKESITASVDALEAISRMAMGGMRDAQSILDQMISFCGKEISQQDVLEVYGLASREQIKSLGEILLEGSYDGVLKITDSFANQGIDFYRTLLDLSSYYREFLVECLSKDEKEYYPEQCVRILDSLRSGEELVRLGLSDKTNFEVTLFRAIEAGQSRSIDQVIRKISSLIPKDSKKKRPDGLITEFTTSTESKELITVQTKHFSDSTIDSKNYQESKSYEDAKVAESDSKSNFVLNINPAEVADELQFKASENSSKEKSRKIVDQNLIQMRISSLPSGLRQILVENFQADFVSIEKIDPDLLV